MKKIYLIATVLLAFLLQGCTNLHEEILNEQDNSSLVSNPSNAAMVAAPAYAALRDLMSDGGSWKVTECCTDEAIFPTRGSDWNDVNNRTLFWHTYDATNTVVRNTWNGLMQHVTSCNVALNYLGNMKQTDDVKEYMNEVTVLRSLFMYYLMDYYGHFPFREASETDYSSKPTILSRVDALARIIKDLQTVIPNLKEKGAVPYGRVTKATAQTILAHVYLNYQVFTGKAPAFTDGESKWDEVISLCDDIIKSGKYQLADDYWKMFLSDNADYCDKTEGILPIIYDQATGTGGSNWLNMALHYSMTFNNFKSFWNGCCTTPTFVDSWDPSDPRYTSDRLKSQIGFNIGIIGGQQYSVAGEKLKTRLGIDLYFTKEFSVDNATEEQGYRVVKFAPNPDYQWGSGSDNDVMFYRYSDIYLMRGEAKFRKGNDIAGAVEDINAVRKARGVKEYTSSGLTLDSFYKERGYEFYWEGMARRDDMVRFNHYCEARYNVEKTPAYKILFPIPQTALEANSDLQQNEGY